MTAGQNHNIQDLPGRHTKSIGSPLKLFTMPLFKRLQPKESYSGLCLSSNQMTFKSTAHLYFNVTSVGHIFCVTSKEKGISLRGEETPLLLYRKDIQIFLPAIRKEWVLISSNSVGNLALRTRASSRCFHANRKAFRSLESLLWFAVPASVSCSKDFFFCIFLVSLGLYQNK